MNLPLHRASGRLVFIGFLSIAAFVFVDSFEASELLHGTPADVSSDHSANPNFGSLIPAFSKRDFSPEPPLTLVGSYYTVEQGIDAKLMLNNKGASTLEVRPTIRSLDGQTLEIAPVYVDGQSFRFIDLQEWIDQGGPAFRSGSIELFHTGLDLVLGAQIYLEHRGRRLSFEEKLAEMGKFNSQKQEAIWFQPSEQTETKIVLSNKLGIPLTVTGNLSKAPRRVGDTQTFQLAAYETKFLDLKADFTDGQQFANADMVGLSFTHTGAADALQARVFVYDRQLGYSNLAQFSNPNGGKSSEYQGVGLQIEDIAGLKLDPVIVVKNVGDQNSTVTAKVPYTRTDGSTGVIDLPQVTLKPSEMKFLDVQQIKQRVAQQSILAASLELEYTTAPGSVVTAAHTQTADRDLIFRLPMWDPFAQKSPTGGYPWRIEGTSTTKTYIKNITNREQYYVAFLSWEDGGRYMIGMKAVAPHQTIEIDVKKLRDEQTPDETGQVIPLDISKGQLKWSLKRTMTPAPGEELRDSLALAGRTEQIDVENGTSSNYACQNWCESSYLASYLTPSSPEAEVGEQIDFKAYQNDYDPYGVETGYYLRLAINSYGPTYWSSNQTSIATIDSTSLATAAAPGTTTISATWQDYSAPVGTICEPGFAGAVDSWKDASASFRPEPCAACTAFSIMPAPSVSLVVKPPTVKFSEIGSVEQGATKAITATVSNRGNYQITLFLMKSNNQATPGITFDDGSSSKVLPNTNGNHSVTIKGLTRSGQLDDYKIEARYGENNFYLAGLKPFTVSGLGFVEAAACSGFDEVTVSNVLAPYILVPKSGSNTLKAVLLPSGATGNFKLEVATTPSNQVTVSPTTVNTNNQVVTVNGGNTAGNFKVNVSANQQNSTVSKEPNVYVRNRVDKTLIFYAVTEDGSPDTPPPPSNIPTAADLQTYLNDVWGKQANVYFMVTKGADFEVNYDLDSDGRIDSSSPPEVEAVINGQNDGSKDYNLYFLGLRVKTLASGSTPAAFSSFDSKVGVIGHVYNGTRDYITAHEMGHLLGTPGRTAEPTFLMWESDSSTSPCKIGKNEWDIVQP